MSASRDLPILSVIVVVHDMEREAPRTLLTLTPGYQGLPAELYEVIVVDNGSPRPLGEARVREMAEHFKYVYLEPGNPSPVEALNLGASLSRGRLMGFMIDGARMLSPGVLRYALRANRAYDNPVVSTLGYHLGQCAQPLAVARGYDQAEEDRLLDSVDWRRDGYELFRISAPAQSSRFGCFAPISESNCLFVTPEAFDAVGGFHPGFATRGGGLANLDFYREVCELPGTELVVLLGEGSFHQFHDGAMTGKTEEEGARFSALLHEEYVGIRGRPFRPPAVTFDVLGRAPSVLLPLLGESPERYAAFRREQPDVAEAFESAPRPPSRVADADEPGRAIIILGMHRSGTSVLAGTLQEAGLDLGDVVRVAPHNRKGNRENRAIQHMQENLLETNGGSWSDVPNVVRWSDLHRAVRDEFIAGFRGASVWGFKDPRTLFTLDGWLEVLPHAELVGIFRQPVLVASSLQRRDGFTFEQGLDLWRRYNEKLLERHRARPFPLIEFHDDPELLREQLGHLCRSLRLPGGFRALRFFDDELRTRLEPGGRDPGDALEIYEELRSRASPLGPDNADDAPPEGYRRQLSEEEIAQGAHRGFVGGLWEQIGRLQFDFLRERGLRPGDRLLDVGCGALRGGVHFIRYLDPGGYYGVDMNESLLAAAARVELPAAGLTERRPHLLLNDRFEFRRFGVTFRWALAQSVFTHLPLDSIERCLVNVAEVLEPGGRFYATFFEAPTERHVEEIQRPDGIVTHADADPFHHHPRVFESLVANLPLTVRNLGGWEHPRAQHILEFVRL